MIILSVIATIICGLYVWANEDRARFLEDRIEELERKIK